MDRVKKSLCRAILRETRKLHNYSLPTSSTSSATSSAAAIRHALQAKHHDTPSIAKKSAVEESQSSHSKLGENGTSTEASSAPQHYRPDSFRMPAVTELWGTGVYQELDLHYRSLRRLLPPRLNDYVPGIPGRDVVRKDVLEWLNDDSEAFEILKALKYQKKIASCSSSQETRGLLVEAVTGYSAAISHPASDRHVFSYNIRFTNTSSKNTYRVIGRAFVFENGEGKITSTIRPDTKECMGIVGFTPVLQPGDQFLYGSGTTFNTEEGFISGSFHVIEDRVRSHEFETKSLRDRYDFFDKLIRKHDMEENAKSFRASFPVIRFDASVSSLDMSLLMAKSQSRDNSARE